MDYSTLNIEKLRTLKTYKLPPTYRLSSHMGSGCYLDAPGFPSYFLQSVYTQYGNTPAKGPGVVIEFEGTLYVIAEDLEKRQKLLLDLWNPLPLYHERSKAWLSAVYSHMKNCYTDDSTSSWNRTLIFPVPAYKLKCFVDDLRFSDDWRAKEKAAVEAANASIIEAAKAIAIPQNHSAVRWIQKFYQYYTADLQMIENPPETYAGDWYKRLAEKPTPQNCPGSHGRKHPETGWCQFCGQA